MKILIVSQYFHPEQFKCNDLAAELQRRGHDVTVLTGIPNYPSGHFFQGYGLFRKRRELWKGVKIHRAWLIPRGKSRGWELALNYLSFAFFASIRGFFLMFRKRFDVIFVHETSPITVGIPAIMVKRWQKIPLYFWVLDIWPESLTAAGGITNKKVLKFFTSLTRWIYKNSDKILMSSKDFRKSILEKGDFGEKLYYFPNWADEFGKVDHDFLIPDLPVGFIAMFAGNIGESQDFESLMQTALLLRDRSEIHFVIVGDGRKKPWVDAFVHNHHLERTVHLVGRFPKAAMPAFYEKADVMLVSLKATDAFSLWEPTKISACMAAGKPIAMMMNGAGPKIIKEANCGLTVPSGDAIGLSEIIKRMADMKKEDLQEMGKRGREYCNKHFNFSRQMDLLEKLLSEDVRNDT